MPGVNVAAAGYLAAAAVGATAASAAGHGALVSAGHASKVDLGLDIFALATFGAGRVVASGLRSTQAATRAAAAQAARKAARDASLDASRATREAAGRVLTDPRSSSEARRGARDRIDLAHRQALRAGTDAARDVRATPLAEATKTERRMAGNVPDAQRYKDIRAMEGAFAHDPGVGQAAARAGALAGAGRIGFQAGMGSDVADRILDDTFEAEAYMQMKERFTREVGSTW